MEEGAARIKHRQPKSTADGRDTALLFGGPPAGRDTALLFGGPPRRYTNQLAGLARRLGCPGFTAELCGFLGGLDPAADIAADRCMHTAADNMYRYISSRAGPHPCDSRPIPGHWTPAESSGP